MTITDFKNLIQERTGVPAALLDGSTPDEILAKARSLIAYRGKTEAGQPKTTAQQFEEYFRARMGEDVPKDTPGAALDEIEEALRRARGGYPQTPDGGEADHAGLPDGRPAREQFAEWFSQKTACDPRRDDPVWTRIT